MCRQETTKTRRINARNLKKNSIQKLWRHFLENFWQNAQMLQSRVPVAVSSFKYRGSVSEFLTKPRSRLEILTRSSSRCQRLRFRLHHCHRQTSNNNTESWKDASEDTKSAMSNPNGLLVQKSCHYLNQSRTFYDILMRAAHWMACFDLS